MRQLLLRYLRSDGPAHVLTALYIAGAVLAFVIVMVSGIAGGPQCP